MRIRKGNENAFSAFFLVEKKNQKKIFEIFFGKGEPRYLTTLLHYYATLPLVISSRTGKRKYKKRRKFL